MKWLSHVPWLSSILLLGLVPTCTARAEPRSSEAVVEQRREHAKVEFKRASELYRAGQYQKSVAAFMAADELYPSAALSFNIALAYEKLADTGGALRWYRDYLRRSPRAANAAAVHTRVDELSTKLALSGLQQLTVVSTPRGAVVTIDGHAIGATPLTTELALGQHQLELDLTGYRRATQKLALTAGAPLDISLALSLISNRSRPAPSPAPGVATSPAHDGRRRFGIAPWLFMGVGSAGLGGALAFELARRSDEDAARQATSQINFKARTDAMQRTQTTARVLSGLGGALLVGGAVLLIFNDRPPTTPRLGLACTLTGCSASAKGRF